MKYMKSFKEFREEMMKDPEFKKHYDELEPEFALISLMIEGRIKEGLTQKGIAKKMGTKQSAISRFESGSGNPTMKFMYRLADALGADMKVTITKKNAA